MEGAPAESVAAPVSPPPAPAAETPSVEPKVKAPAHFEDEAGLFKTVCRLSMNKKCTRDNCEYVHDKKLCKFFWRTGECKFGAECKHNHFVTITPKTEEEEKASADAAAKPAKTKAPKDKSKKDESKDKSKEKPKKDESKEKPKKDESKEKPKKDGKSKDESKKDGKSKDESKKDGRSKDESKKDGRSKDKSKDESKSKSEKVRTVKGKNTEVFEPMTKPVDLRVTYDLGGAADAFSTPLTSRDVLLAPNIFNDFAKGELYAKLLQELEGCGVPEERLLKMWHGNDKIDGTHLIADDKTRWKTNCPTFQLVIDRLAKFFSMEVQATRFNWYKDTSQWKPFHFDAAAVKPEIAAKQNFTIGVSFGATRDAAFEHAKTRTVVSLPQPDSCVYAFARDTNIIWRHGILQDVPVRQEGRISVIAWGWIDGMTDPLDATPASEAK